jgi:hypothetical protein
MAIIGFTGSMAIGACGGGSGVTPPTGPYADVLGGLCDVLSRCPSLTAKYPIVFTDRDQCEAILDWAFTCHLDTNDTGGSITFTISQSMPTVTDAQAQACVDWLKMATCDSLANGTGGADSPCANLLVKTSSNGAAVGASCESSSCVDGAYCADPTFDPATGNRTCRTCEALPAAGAACTASGQCATGLYCNYLPGGMQQCAALLSDGAACTGGNACTSAFCNQGTMMCDPHGKDGDACGTSNDCRAGSYCKASVCAPMVKNGGACVASTDCVNGMCDATTHVCGQPNASSCFSDSQCASNFCDSSMASTCQPQLPNGTHCTMSDQCASGYCDVFTTQSCIDHCYSDTDCPSGQFCSFQSETCSPPGPDGASCDTDNQCASGSCRTTGVCGAAPMIGGSCMSSDDCYPIGSCQNGTCVALKGPGAFCASIDACAAPYICSKGICVLMNLECKPAPAGKMCAYLRVCDDNSYCGSDFYCVARKGAGSMCSSSAECATGTFCDSTSGMYTCRKQGAQGDTCTTPDGCGAGLYCVANGGTGTCSAGPAGMPCDPFASGTTCPTGLYCDHSTSACLPDRTLGQMCDDYTEPCTSDLYCDPGLGCQMKKGLGDMCATYQPCGPNLYCSNMTSMCQASVGMGQPCSTSYPNIGCKDGLRCVYDTMTSMEICQPQLQNGMSCSNAADCASGICDYTYGCLASNMCVAPM